MTDGSLFVNANNFNRTMTLVDKELKSSKEEFILHFKREYERSLATAIGRFSDDRHQGYGLPMNCQEEPLWKEQPHILNIYVPLFRLHFANDRKRQADFLFEYIKTVYEIFIQVSFLPQFLYTCTKFLFIGRQKYHINNPRIQCLSFIAISAKYLPYQ